MDDYEEKTQREIQQMDDRLLKSNEELKRMKESTKSLDSYLRNEELLGKEKQREISDLNNEMQ